jgi:hypothetical protein
MWLDPRQLPTSRAKLGGQLAAVRARRHPVFPYASLVLIPDDERIVTDRELIFTPTHVQLPSTATPSQVAAVKAGFADGLEVTAQVEGHVLVALGALFADKGQGRQPGRGPSDGAKRPDGGR